MPTSTSQTRAHLCPSALAPPRLPRLGRRALLRLVLLRGRGAGRRVLRPGLPTGSASFLFVFLLPVLLALVLLGIIFLLAVLRRLLRLARLSLHGRSRRSRLASAFALTFWDLKALGLLLLSVFVSLGLTVRFVATAFPALVLWALLLDVKLVRLLNDIVTRALDSDGGVLFVALLGHFVAAGGRHFDLIGLDFGGRATGSAAAPLP